MILGASQIEITPEAGCELSGFAARIQPSLGTLDPLWAKAFFFVDGGEKLLWIHCDLIGFDHKIVADFREWAGANLGLRPGQIMLSATHTHSGPCTIFLQEAGCYDPAYVRFLHEHLREASKLAMVETEPVEMVNVEGQLDLAIDRRGKNSSHTDPRVAAIGFQRAKGNFAAVIVNYPMHPVALGASNRMVSADVSGQISLELENFLPGKPVVFATNGACANLNPPAENVPFSQVKTWGQQIAGAVGSRLLEAIPTRAPKLRVTALSVPLPLEVLDVDGINGFASKALDDADANSRWGAKYRRVVEKWRSSLLLRSAASAIHSHRETELFAVCLGEIIFLGANAEVFSEFTDWIRSCTEKKVYFIGYANGDVGYLPTNAAYAEGGYEVDIAHLFYGGFRLKPGGLELLAQKAKHLVRGM